MRTEFRKSETRRDRQVIVITGASAGVGRATARAFGREGACIGLIARDEDRLNAAKAEIEHVGGRALVLPADVSDSGLIEKAAELIEAEFGPIDIWVNNAMATVFAPFERVRAEEFKRATEVTYLGCVYGTMAALKRMKRRDRGVIVQVGSALARRSIPLQSPYCGAKHAILGFTDSIRSELIHDGSNVWITVVNLPALNTRNSNGLEAVCRGDLSPFHPYFNRRLPPMRSCGRPGIGDANSTSDSPQSRRLLHKKSCQDLRITILPRRVTTANKPQNQPIRIGLITCSLPFTDNSRHTADLTHKRA